MLPDAVDRQLQVTQSVELIALRVLLGDDDAVDDLVRHTESPKVHSDALSLDVARVSAARDPDAAVPFIAHALAAWQTVHAQQQLHERTVVARIDLQERVDDRADLERQAVEDPLTGVGNRRLFERQDLPAHTEASLFAVDHDHFKEINDTHGHAIGDEVLRRVAMLLRSCGRDDDLVCRLGGDEFVVVSPGMPRHVMDRRADRITTAVAGHDWERLAAGLRVSISVGAAHGTGGVDVLYEAADGALYEAKRAGRSGWRTTIVTRAS